MSKRPGKQWTMSRSMRKPLCGHTLPPMGPRAHWGVWVAEPPSFRGPNGPHGALWGANGGPRGAHGAHSAHADPWGPWRPLGTHGDTCGYMGTRETHGNAWGSMGSHGDPWEPSVRPSEGAIIIPR